MNSNAWMSLLSFVGIGALFLWVMRAGGCGAHAHGGTGGHRHGHEHGSAAETTERAAAPVSPNADRDSSPIDPVCGMAVASTSLRRDYMGKKFFFCSQDCYGKFDADPLTYVRGQAISPRRRAHGC